MATTTTTNTEENQSRDAYGFAISKENKQPKDWKEVLRKEEEERQVAWYEFLRRGEDGMTPPTHAKRKMKYNEDNEEEKDDNDEDEEENDSFDAVRAVMALIRDDDSADDDADDNKEEKKKKKKKNTDTTSDEVSSSSEFDGKRRKELEMLVNNGLPMSQRAKLWEIFANVPSKRKKGLYDDLVRRIEETVEENNADDNSYNPILSERNGSPPKDANDDTNNNNNNKATLPTSDDDDKCESKLFDIYNHVQSFADAKVQVEKDLPRTFPAHPLLEGVGRDALRRVLLAYARYNPKVGYCQGLNFLAGLLLLLMPEESAFYVLGTIVEDILPGYFVTKQMLAPSVDQKILRVFVSQKLPTLLEKLDKFNIPLSAITLNWFLCLFVNCLPWETALRVWDVLLFKRDRTVLFQVTLALLESPSILKAVKEPASDVSALATALQSAVTEAFDASALMMTATLGNADVTMHKVEQLARKHKKSVAKEIFGADYHQFMTMSMSFAFTNTTGNNNKDSGKDAEDADSKKLGEMFEKWCTPEKEERVSLTTTPELADDNIDEEGASLDEKISKVLRFDERTKMDDQRTTREEKGGGGDEAESAPTTTTTTTGSFGTSFKEWMSTARKSWEFKRKSSSKEVEVTSSGSGRGGATAAPASSEEYDENNDAVVEEQTSSDAAPLHSRLEKLERDAKREGRPLEERLLLSSK
ncbi:unnamed protein product [Bathycoccus prasinos]